MVTDAQVRRLKKLSKTETKELAAAKAGMDVKTARKYLAEGRMPSEAKPERSWRTREDPFERVWGEIREQVRTNPGLESKAIFEALQRQRPGRVRQDGQLRTWQRRIKRWRVDGRARPGDFLRTAACAGTAGAVRLHQHERGRRDHRRAKVSAPAVSLRVDVLELGRRPRVLLGELREFERRIAERAVGVGRRAARAPDRSHVDGGEQHDRRERVHHAV